MGKIKGIRDRELDISKLHNLWGSYSGEKLLKTKQKKTKEKHNVNTPQRWLNALQFNQDINLYISRFISSFQAKAVVMDFTGLIQRVAPQMTRSKLSATWKPSKEVGP